nr:PIN-like domain-containing protein [Streptococcus troglodytae]
MFKGDRSNIEQLKKEIEETISNKLPEIQREVENNITSINNVVSKYIKQLNKEIIEPLISRDYIKKSEMNIKYYSEVLFEKCLGEKYSAQKIKNIGIEGEKRFKNNIPPGFQDDEKFKNIVIDGEIFQNKFGDYAIWKDIIEYCKNKISINDKFTNVVIVSDDKKEDWRSNKQSMRSELKQEFYFETGLPISMLSSAEFIEKVSNNRELANVARKTVQALDQELTKQKDLDIEAINNGNYESLVGIWKNSRGDILDIKFDGQVNDDMKLVKIKNLNSTNKVPCIGIGNGYTGAALVLFKIGFKNPYGDQSDISKARLILTQNEGDYPAEMYYYRQ